MSSSDRPSSPWPRSKVGPPRPEQPAAAKCATQLSHRASRPRTLTLHHSSTYRVHFSPARAVALRRARGSNFAGGGHEKRGISSSIGIQIWFFVITLLMRNSSLTFPACPTAQVGVDFLDGEEWVRSTSFSTLGIWIFDSLFDPVDVVSQEGLDRSAVEAFFEYPRLVPILAYPCPSRTPDSCPPADSVWPRFTCPCTQDGAFDREDGRGRAGGGAAGCGGAVAASERLLPLRAAAGVARGWPVEGQAGRALRAAGAGAAAESSVERAEESRWPRAEAA